RNLGVSTWRELGNVDPETRVNGMGLTRLQKAFLNRHPDLKALYTESRRILARNWRARRGILLRAGEKSMLELSKEYSEVKKLYNFQTETKEPEEEE
ncbi:MAG: hypothetical protein ACPLYF_03965, partial [Fervidobacterium sp.]